MTCQKILYNVDMRNNVDRYPRDHVLDFSHHLFIVAARSRKIRLLWRPQKSSWKFIETKTTAEKFWGGSSTREYDVILRHHKILMMKIGTVWRLLYGKNCENSGTCGGLRLRDGNFLRNFDEISSDITSGPNVSLIGTRLTHYTLKSDSSWWRHLDNSDTCQILSILGWSCSKCPRRLGRCSIEDFEWRDGSQNDVRGYVQRRRSENRGRGGLEGGEKILRIFYEILWQSIISLNFFSCRKTKKQFEKWFHFLIHVVSLWNYAEILNSDFDIL